MKDIHTRRAWEVFLLGGVSGAGKTSLIRFPDENYPLSCPSTSLRYAQGERERGEKTKNPFMLSVAAPAAESKHLQRMAKDHVESV